MVRSRRWIKELQRRLSQSRRQVTRGDKMLKLDWTGKATKNIARIVGSVAFIFGAVFGSLEYERSLEQDKENRSFEYFQAYMSGDVAQSRRNIRKAIENAYKEGGNEDESSNGKSIDDLLVAKLDTFPNDFSLDIMVEYYDSVYQCMVLGSCNGCALGSLLHDGANELYPFLIPVIQERVDGGYKKYGWGLERLADEKEVGFQC